MSGLSLGESESSNEGPSSKSLSIDTVAERKQRKCLVTGGSGYSHQQFKVADQRTECIVWCRFVGRYLAEALIANGDKVRSVSLCRAFDMRSAGAHL